MAEKSPTDRVKEAIQQYGPTAVALIRLAVEMYNSLRNHGPARWI